MRLIKKLIIIFALNICSYNITNQSNLIQKYRKNNHQPNIQLDNKNNEKNIQLDNKNNKKNIQLDNENNEIQSKTQTEEMSGVRVFAINFAMWFLYFIVIVSNIKKDIILRILFGIFYIFLTLFNFFYLNKKKGKDAVIIATLSGVSLGVFFLFLSAIISPPQSNHMQA